MTIGTRARGIERELRKLGTPERAAGQIGWVLRETSKHRPDEVHDWLAPRTHRASGVTVREAVKYLPAADAERLMRAYRAGRPAG